MKHLLYVEDLTRQDIERICDRAASFAEVADREIKKVPALRGRTVLNLFYEASTRTRSSFELAAKRLSADVVNFSASGSSVEKGESLKDTALTLSAYDPAAIVIRHPYAGAAQMVAGWTAASVVNAGDGKHEHPSQALLDVYTLRRRLGLTYPSATLTPVVARVVDLLRAGLADPSAARAARRNSKPRLVAG